MFFRCQECLDRFQYWLNEQVSAALSAFDQISFFMNFSELQGSHRLSTACSFPHFFHLQNGRNATVLDKIKWNSKPPSPPSPPPPQIKDEAARRAKRAIFPSLIWGGGAWSRFSIYFVQDCMEGVNVTK